MLHQGIWRKQVSATWLSAQLLEFSVTLLNLPVLPRPLMRGKLIPLGWDITDPCWRPPGSPVLEVTCHRAAFTYSEGVEVSQALNKLSLMPNSSTSPCSKLYHFLQFVPVTLHAGISIWPSLSYLKQDLTTIPLLLKVPESTYMTLLIHTGSVE